MQHSIYSPILILGGGSSGLAIQRALAKVINPSLIKIVDAKINHFYQPYLTSYSTNETSQKLSNIYKPMKDIFQDNLVPENVNKVDPSKNLAFLDNEIVKYDYLIIASGIDFDWKALPNLKQLLDDSSTKIGSAYGFNNADKYRNLLQDMRDKKNQKILFTEPETPVKCGGDQAIYLTQDYLRDNDNCFQFRINKKSDRFQNEYLKIITENEEVDFQCNKKLVKLEKDYAVFEDSNKNQEKVEFDLLHYVPQQKPGEFIKKSGLGDNNGFVDVNQKTLQHNKYDNIFAIGDCGNFQVKKNMSTIFSQVPVLRDNIMLLYNNVLPTKGEQKVAFSNFQPSENKVPEPELENTFYLNYKTPNQLFFYLKKHVFPIVYWKLVTRGLWFKSQ